MGERRRRVKARGKGQRDDAANVRSLAQIMKRFTQRQHAPKPRGARQSTGVPGWVWWVSWPRPGPRREEVERLVDRHIAFEPKHAW